MNRTEQETHIKNYIDAGYRLFDCFTYDKAPCDVGWKETPRGNFPASITYGVALGDDDLIIDYDPRRDPDKNQLVLFWNEVGITPPVPTFTVGTNQGCHIYFRKPLGFAVRNSSLPGYPAVEIKTKGRYVVGAGSYHPAGLYYTPIRLDPHQVIEAPNNLLLACRKPNEDGPAMIGVQQDDEYTRGRFINWINSGGHNHGLFVCACYGRDMGLSPSTIVELIDTHCNVHWGEPATVSDIQSRVNNAFRYGQNAAGSKNVTGAVYNSVIGDVDQTKAPSKPPGLSLEPLWDIQRKPDGTPIGIKPSAPSVLAQLCQPTHKDTRTPNIEEINPLLNLLRFNEFSQQIEFTRPAPWHTSADIKEWRDVDTTLFSVWLSQHTPVIDPSDKAVETAITAVAHTDAFHPVRDWLDSIQWDGKNRIEALLSYYAGAKHNRYTAEISKNTMIAFVARIYEPGCQHDSSIVLEGEQDKGKSSFVRILGGDYSADVAIDPRVKDTYVNMLGCWIIEMSEMEFMSKVDVNAVKRFLTIRTDRFRMPYARRSISIPRQCVFMGTVNAGDSGYLRDTTGNRRFWVVETGDFKLEELKRDRLQLFAEAVFRYKHKEKWHITDPEIKLLAKREQDARMVKETWTETIEAWLYNPMTIKPPVLTTTAILLSAIGMPVEKHTRSFSDRVASAMRELGYEYGSVWDVNGVKSRKGWVKQ